MRSNEISLHEFVPKEKTRKIFAKVFDESTIQAVHALATKGHLDLVEFVISTGKEAHVFRARDSAGNFRAVKIYKIETSGFKRMIDYLEGDKRFKRVKKGRRELVFAWTKKEFKNLQLLNKIGVRAPFPIAFNKNVLVMEFIGDKGKAAPTLKEKPIQNVRKLHEWVVDVLAKMLYKGELIHSDFSEHNILNFNEELVLIDCAQAVLSTHPKAKEFFERDVRKAGEGIIGKKGFETDFDAFLDEIRAKKALFVKK